MLKQSINYIHLNEEEIDSDLSCMNNHDLGTLLELYL